MWEIEIDPALNLTEPQKQIYLESFGTKCPHCGKSDGQDGKYNEYGSLEMEDDHYQRVTCGHCGKEWYEVYRFVAIEAVTT